MPIIDINPTPATISEQDAMLEKAKALGEAPKITVQQANAILKELNPEKVLQESRPKIEDALLESAANERAAKEPLPSIVEEAFSNEPLVVKTSLGDVTIRPMVAYDINIFKAINSPFYQIMMGDKTNVTSTDQLFENEEESYEVVYQFTHPPKEVYQLFKQGKNAFKDKVMEEVAFRYTLMDSVTLLSKIMEHIFHVNLARVQFDNPEPETTDTKKNLTPPINILTSN